MSYDSVRNPQDYPPRSDFSEENRQNARRVWAATRLNEILSREKPERYARPTTRIWRRFRTLCYRLRKETK